MFNSLGSRHSLAALAGLLLLAPVLTVGQAPDKDSAATESDKQAYLGLQLGPVPELLRLHLPEVLGDDIGLVVFGVDEDSPAATAGLQKGDILTETSGDPVRKHGELLERIAAEQPGAKLDLTLVRGGKPLRVSVTLGERPADFPAAARDQDWPTFGPDFAVPGFDNNMPGFGNLAEMQRSLQRMNEMMEKMNDEMRRSFSGKFPALDPDQFSQSFQSSSSSNFVSININKVDGDRYRVQVKYKAEDGETRDLDMEGTVDEVTKAVEADEKMPSGVRKQVLRSLKMEHSEALLPKTPKSFEEMQKMLKDLQDRAGRIDL
jgi:hypothetical protein